MNKLRPSLRLRTQAVVVAAAICVFAGALRAQDPISNDPPQYGPFNGVFLSGGDGIRAPLAAHDSVLRADSSWSLYCWVRADEPIQNSTLIAGVGDTKEEYPRYLGADAHSIFLWIGQDNVLSAPVTLTPATWHLLAATFDGTQFRVFSDGARIASGSLLLGSVGAEIQTGASRAALERRPALRRPHRVARAGPQCAQRR